MLLALAVICMRPDGALAQQLLGRTIADVRVQVAGETITDPSIIQLIETRVGEPLSMERVRESIDHLVGLGRFEDVRVFAELSETAGVVMRWSLVPVQRIERIRIEGEAALPHGALREEIALQVGTSPVVARLDEIVETLTAYYRARGYRRPSISPRIVPAGTAGTVTLVLAIDAGPRTTIRNVAVRGDAGRPAAAVLDALDLERGRPYDASAIERRVAAFEDELRNLGYYEASLDVIPRFDDEAAAADIDVEVVRGPRVRVVFAGDPLPGNRTDALVPIRQERSVDLDLLEDASRNIETFLRQEGYRSAEAPYVREDRGDEMVLTFTVRRGPLHRVGAVRATGNEAISSAELAPLLPLARGEPFADSRVARVAAALTELYRVRGFARAAVKPQITVLPAPREGAEEVRTVDIEFVITEGPQTLVGDVTIAGSSALESDRLMALLRLTPGRPFYRPQLEADRDAMERVYSNEGFQSVRVTADATLQDNGRRVDVQWQITEGPRVIVDRVLVTGNVRTSADVIRREMVLQPGSPLGDDALIESQRRISALGLFRRVRIVELPHSASPLRDILVEVEEAPATAVGYGGGLEVWRSLRRAADSDQAEERIEIAPRAFFEASRRNLWGKNRSISLFTRVSLRPRDPGTDADPADTGGYGFHEYRILGTFREPRLFDVPGDLAVTGFVEQAIRSSFNFNRRGIRLDYARRLGGAVTVSGRYAFDRTRLFDTKILPDDQLLIDRLFPQVRLSTVTASVLRDTRNDVIDPEGGSLLGVDHTFALRALGSEVGFSKTFLQGFVYRRLPGATPFTVAAGVRLGVALGFARIVNGDVVDDVPASERFFAGGESTVRGFVLDRLGTSDTLNDQGFPTGGNGLAVVNVELRSPYWNGLGAVGFVDAGNVFRRPGDISLDQLRPSAGAGVRYRSPLGPLRFDVGFNLDRQFLPTGARERGVVFHVSLGQAF